MLPSCFAKSNQQFHTPVGQFNCTVDLLRLCVVSKLPDCVVRNNLISLQVGEMERFELCMYQRF